MSDTITLTGIVATPPKHIVTSEGLQITSFRLASAQRRYDKAQQSWVDADTNWYTVTAFRTLAANAIGSILKGQRVIVSGRLRIREWASGEKTGTTIEVDADSLGHDLMFGTSSFTRTPQTPATADTAESAPKRRSRSRRRRRLPNRRSTISPRRGRSGRASCPSRS